MPRAFVTGASGFVGRRLMQHLAQHGYEVVALSRSEKSDTAIKAALPTAQIARGDLSSTSALAQGMQGCDVVFHSAARVEQYGKWAQFLEDTVEGSRRTAAAAAQAGVKRFVHVSTEAVFVQSRLTDLDVKENSPIDPPAWAKYSKSKALAEAAVQSFNGQGLDVMIVRPRFIWGKGDTTLLPAFIQAAQSGQLKWPQPDVRFSTAHIENVCEGLRLAAEKGKAGAAYHITDGDPISMKEFITSLVATRDVKPPSGTVSSRFLWNVGWVVELLAPFTGWGETRAPPVSRQMVALMFVNVVVHDDWTRQELGYREVMGRAQGLQELRDEFLAGAALPGTKLGF